MVEFRKISDNACSDAVIVTRGLGTEGDPHPDLTSFLSERGMEVHFFDRKGDVLLRYSDAIEIYCGAIRESVESLVRDGKRVHLAGISFGWFLAIRLSQDVRTNVRSIVAIAPLIDPFASVSRICEPGETEEFISVRLSNGSKLPILRENVELLEGWTPENTDFPTIAILGGNDELERTENLGRISGKNVSTHVLPGVRHGETTGHPKTRELLSEFYAGVL